MKVKNEKPVCTVRCIDVRNHLYLTYLGAVILSCMFQINAFNSVKIDTYRFYVIHFKSRRLDGIYKTLKN
jgi:hypothetical protein